MGYIIKFLALLMFLCCVFNNAFAEIDILGFRNSGHVETFFFPPHNEYDPNPGIPFAERNTARYALDFYTKISHQTILPKLFGFVDSFSAFGATHPQIDYNYSADPIVMILTYGAGYQISKHSELRITSSRHINLGGYTLDERLIWNSISYRLNW